jgi:hypothetical protein
MKMHEQEITGKVLAVVCFGRPTDSTGMQAGQYFQVTIDPSACSPKGDYIRFGLHTGDELVGWQRVDAITVVEVLGDSDQTMPNVPAGYKSEPTDTVTMMVLE